MKAACSVTTRRDWFGWKRWPYLWTVAFGSIAGALVGVLASMHPLIGVPAIAAWWANETLRRRNLLRSLREFKASTRRAAFLAVSAELQRKQRDRSAS